MHSSPTGWWIGPAHLTLLGATFTQRRMLGASMVEALCMPMGIRQHRRTALRQFFRHHKEAMRLVLGDIGTRYHDPRSPPPHP